MELQQIKNLRHREIIKSINNNLPMTTILKQQDISRPTYYKVKKRYQEALVIVQDSDIVEQSIDGYGNKLIDSGKFIALKLATTLMNKNYSGASLSQLTTSLVNVNAMIRLEQGKSTENIAHGVIHNLNPEQLTLIKESIMNLKKSMLNSGS